MNFWLFLIILIWIHTKRAAIPTPFIQILGEISSNLSWTTALCAHVHYLISTPIYCDRQLKYQQQVSRCPNIYGPDVWNKSKDQNGTISVNANVSSTSWLTNVFRNLYVFHVFFRKETIFQGNSRQCVSVVKALGYWPSCYNYILQNILGHEAVRWAQVQVYRFYQKRFGKRNKWIENDVNCEPGKWSSDLQINQFKWSRQ